MGVPFGAWPSPLGSDAVAAATLRISDLQARGDAAYWVEGRPAEAGRCVIVRARGDVTEDLLPAPYSARTRVHEYGGGAFVAADGALLFSNAADARLYRLDAGTAVPLTPADAPLRFADMELDASRERVLAVVEDHSVRPARNDIRAVPIRGGEPTPLCSGHDFYSSPRLSPDGARLAWLTWDNPNMPWDGTELWLTELDAAGMPRDTRVVAGGADVSIFQPSWSPDGLLHFVSDESGWWNLHRWDGSASQPVFAVAADCGVPAWMFRFSTYAFLPGGRIAVAGARDGLWSVWVMERDGSASELSLPYTDVDGAVAACGDDILLIAGGPDTPLGVVRVGSRGGAPMTLRRSSDILVPDGIRSRAQPVTFAGHGGSASHGYYYAPRNDSVEAPAAAPPLIVHAHGGPTSAASPALSVGVQYWTSRGFAYLDVDYGGSTGYGRDYRRRLNGEEGVVDVGDCVAGALAMAERGLADGTALLIHGGSAGGYITLCAMTYHDAFAGGSSTCGIADWELLVEETHKFEAHYFDTMIGPYPEARQLLHDRSPIHFIDRVRRPLLILQGEEDPIVPPDQAEAMHVALRDRGVPVALVMFPGEEHGFRRAESIRRALECELSFFCQVLGVEPADRVERLSIENLG